MGCGQLHGALISSPLLRHDPLAQALLATALRTDDVFFKQNAEIAGYIQVEAGNIAFKELRRVLANVLEGSRR